MKALMTQPHSLVESAWQVGALALGLRFGGVVSNRAGFRTPAYVVQARSEGIPEESRKSCLKEKEHWRQGFEGCVGVQEDSRHLACLDCLLCLGSQ